MKNVLIISYYWPPSGGPGVQRVLKFCKYLPSYGWNPIVLTVKDGEFPVSDISLQNDSKYIQSIKVSGVSFYSLFKKIAGKQKLPTHQLSPGLKENFVIKLFRWIRYNLIIPDGRIGWVDGSKFIKYSSFDELKNNDLDVLISNAERLVGIPYLWGGTSSNGFDCSGFTKTLYYMNGLIIPRDASQQIKIGQIVDSVSNWKNLKIGDLLFFGYKNEEKFFHL